MTSCQLASCSSGLEKSCRDARQWQPRRQLADQDSDEDLEEDGSGGASEAVSFQDIKSSMLGPCLNRSPAAGMCSECRATAAAGLPLPGAAGSAIGYVAEQRCHCQLDASNSQAGLSGSLAQLLLQPGWLTQGAPAVQLDPKFN
ncbi:hypothetical protein ABBQ38_005978 [Trebouxia sp. C0009 RCD-2024]